MILIVCETDESKKLIVELLERAQSNIAYETTEEVVDEFFRMSLNSKRLAERISTLVEEMLLELWDEFINGYNEDELESINFSNSDKGPWNTLGDETMDSLFKNLMEKSAKANLIDLGLIETIVPIGNEGSIGLVLGE